MEIIKIVSSNSFKQNTYLLETECATILIDCGSSLNEVKERYKKVTNGKEMPKIDAILLTHSHFDHILYLEEFETEYSCPVYIKKGCKHYLSSPKYNVSNILSAPLTYEPKNIIELNEGLMSIGNIEINVIFTPGHSICSCCFLIYDTLFSGDTLFYLSVGRYDLIGGNYNKLSLSLDKIKQLNYNTCYPGHGVPFFKEKNDYII